LDKAKRYSFVTLFWIPACAGMTNVEHFNFNEYKDIENTYKDMLFFVYFSRVSYIFIIQTYIIFISFKN